MEKENVEKEIQKYIQRGEGIGKILLNCEYELEHGEGSEKEKEEKKKVFYKEILDYASRLYEEKYPKWDGFGGDMMTIVLGWGREYRYPRAKADARKLLKEIDDINYNDQIRLLKTAYEILGDKEEVLDLIEKNPNRCEFFQEFLKYMREGIVDFSYMIDSEDVPFTRKDVRLEGI